MLQHFKTRHSELIALKGRGRSEAGANPLKLSTPHDKFTNASDKKCLVKILVHYFLNYYIWLFFLKEESTIKALNYRIFKMAHSLK